MGFGPIVSPEWLREHLGEPGLAVVDLRWYLDGRSGLAAYEGGHIPGAVFVELDENETRIISARKATHAERRIYETGEDEA